MATKLKVTYFPFPGRGGPIRMALFMRGIEYEEDFTPFAKWGTMKKEGDTEWAGMPMITIMDAKTGEKIDRFGQSNALLRYAGRCPNPNGGSEDEKDGGASKNLLYPLDRAEDCMRIDEILDGAEEAASKLFGINGDDKVAKRQEAWKTSLRAYFLKFADKLARNMARCKQDKAKYLAGPTMTIADLKLYNVFQTIGGGMLEGITLDFLKEKEFENMKIWYDGMVNDEKVKAFEKAFGESLEKFKASQK